MAQRTAQTGLVRIAILTIFTVPLFAQSSLSSAGIQLAPLGSSGLEQTLAAHLQSAAGDQAFADAEELRAAQPGNLAAIYYLASLPRIMANPSPQQLQTASDAANSFLVADSFQSPTLGIEDFRPRALGAAYASLVWIAGRNRDFQEQVRLLTLQLRSDPENRNASYALGHAIFEQRIPARQVEAIFHITRAAFHDGPGALPVDERQKLRNFVRTTWKAFTGTEDGLAGFIDTSQATVFPTTRDELIPFRHDPPSDSGNILEVPASDPQRFLWAAVKDELLSLKGEAYWPTLQGSAFPKLRGTIVRIMRRGQRIVGVEIAILDNRTAEIALQISGGINSKWAIGQQLDFTSAVAISWRRFPTFLLTCQVAASDLYWEAVR